MTPVCRKRSTHVVQLHAQFSACSVLVWSGLVVISLYGNIQMRCKPWGFWVPPRAVGRGVLVPYGEEDIQLACNKLEWCHDGRKAAGKKKMAVYKV